MADPQFLSKTINAWDSIYSSQKSIMLLGNSNTGRTTFAELINKYQYKITNKALIFEKDKYIL
jgi:polynucleotide 5'-kinase involved in rRNA processing